MAENNESGLGVPVDTLTLAVRYLVDAMAQTEDGERLLRIGELAGTIASAALRLQELGAAAGTDHTMTRGQLPIEFTLGSGPAEDGQGEPASIAAAEEAPEFEGPVLTPEEIELEKRVYVTDRQRALLQHVRNAALQGEAGTGMFQMPELLEVLRGVSPDITYDAGLQCVLRFGYRVALDPRYEFYGKGSKVDRSYVFEVLQTAAAEPASDPAPSEADGDVFEPGVADARDSQTVSVDGSEDSDGSVEPLPLEQSIDEEAIQSNGYDGEEHAAASAAEDTPTEPEPEKPVTFSKREQEFLEWWDEHAGEQFSPHELYEHIPAGTPGARMQFLSVLSRKLARDPERSGRFHHTGHRTPKSKYWMDPRPDAATEPAEAAHPEAQEPCEEARGLKAVAAKVTALVVGTAPRVQAQVPGPRTDMRPARPVVEKGPQTVTTIDLPSGIKITSTAGQRRLYYRDRWIRTHSEPLEVLEMIAAHDGPMQIHELESEVQKRAADPSIPADKVSLIAPDNLWWHLYALRRVFAELGTFAFRAHYAQREGRTVGVVELDRTPWSEDELFDQSA